MPGVAMGGVFDSALLIGLALLLILAALALCVCAFWLVRDFYRRRMREEFCKEHGIKLSTAGGSLRARVFASANV